jgi:hypothetical protein
VNKINDVTLTTHTLIGVWIDKAPNADILVMDCEEVTTQKKREKDASTFVVYDIMIQLMRVSVTVDRDDD